MNLKSRKLLLLLVFGVVGWAYRTSFRYREIHNFFRDPNDLAWFSAYLHQKINFCDSPWGETVVQRAGEKETFVSPSGRYEIVPNGRHDEEAYFLVVDNKTGRTLRNATTPFYSDANFKWARDERFLVFTTSITKDDWTSAEVFISDTETGQTLYLGDSEFYDCGLRNW